MKTQMVPDPAERCKSDINLRRINQDFYEREVPTEAPVVLFILKKQQS